MLTLRTAAALLAAADSLDALAAIAAAVGFTAPPLPLDNDARHALGFDDLAREARVVPGAGTLRALLVVVERGASLRERTAALVQRLARHTPHLLWLIVAASPETGQSAIAAWQAGAGDRPRVAALLVDRANVLTTDADTLRALAGVSEAADVLTHAFWHDVLGREALTRRFYRALDGVVSTLAREGRGRASADERRELALLHLSRLLFLVFLEAKGWLDGDVRFLEHRFSECAASGGAFHRRILRSLFFGTLNTPVAARAPAARALGRIPFLNGGLFARAPLERRVALTFPDEALGVVFGELLTRYRFTAREESSDWSEAAIDPEMLGKAFESLMSSTDRRATGAFYTPQAIVSAITQAALHEALIGPGARRADVAHALRGAEIDPRAATSIRERVLAVRVLDPACGSGAFLVHALETMAALARRLGDPRSLGDVRRALLTEAIHGVDVNPTAVWLCELRLWLSVVIESEEVDPRRVPPLPNLDRNIRVGDALAGSAFRGMPPLGRGGTGLAAIRARYARATGARKRTLQRALDRAERALAVAHLERSLAWNAAARRELLVALRGRDLFGDRIRPAPVDRERLRTVRHAARAMVAAQRALGDGAALPFSWSTHFPQVAEAGGFDIIVGNPPWVRLHRIPSATRAAFRERFAVFRAAAWERGAALARAGAGFAAQVDLAALFVERSLDLLRDRGTFALLLPAKLWRSLAGGGVRRLLAERSDVLALEDWSESAHAFDAVVYPSLLLARARGVLTATEPPSCTLAIHGRSTTLRWQLAAARLSLDGDAASPWLAIPPSVREAFERVARAGIPLADSPLGPPQLGVKCGCNEAFVVTLAGGADRLARVRSGERVGDVERDLLRPLVRGQGATAWSAEGRAEFLIWTHGRDGRPLPALPPHAAHWLGHWRRTLASRADARGDAAWWTLFRTASAQRDLARVVWADVGRRPRALVLPKGDPTVALNSCYVLPCRDPRDALAIAALLNSPLAAAWLGAIAEPARGGYRRFLAWTVALLPIPREWSRARDTLAALADRAIEHDDVSPEELLDAAMRAYRLRRADLDPLLAWTAR